MSAELLTERHAVRIAGVLGCYDRILIFGTLPGVCYAGGMTSFLYERQFRIFGYPKFAEPYRERIRENAEGMAAAAGIEIEFVRTRSIRKEDRAQELLKKRGDIRGLSAFYRRWNPATPGRTRLQPSWLRCIRRFQIKGKQVKRALKLGVVVKRPPSYTGIV